MNTWNIKNITELAHKYKTKSDFAKNHGSAYNAAQRLNIWKEISSHMEPMLEFDWTLKKLQKEAKKYNCRSDFAKKSRFAYNKAKDANVLDKICAHMEILWQKKYDKNSLKKIALKYRTRFDFITENESAYNTCIRLKILDEICSHMPPSGRGSSGVEKELLRLIKCKYKNAKKLTYKKVNIEGKPYINGFSLDIYVPELQKGIEFDGTFWHSFEGLKRGRKNWPDEDILNYHDIKDNFFLSNNIKILHIKEKEWIEDKKACLKKCFDFLSSE